MQLGYIFKTTANIFNEIASSSLYMSTLKNSDNNVLELVSETIW